MHKVVNELLDFQIETHIKINSVIRKIPPHTFFRDEEIVKADNSAYVTFIQTGRIDNKEALLHYLFTVGVRFRGKKLNGRKELFLILYKRLTLF